jgi:superfamily II DNA or RNA helicase
MRSTLSLPMPPPNLHRRQREAFDAVFREALKGLKHQLVMLPTGVGKTFLAVAVAQQFKRTLFLVHRQELLEQTISSFAAVDSSPVGVIWGKDCDLSKRYTVGMIQTVAGRIDHIPFNHFDCVIVDECHHAGARTWRETLDHFRCDLRLGLSATPERNDGAPLSNLFDDVVYEMSVKDAVAEGYLVMPKAMMVQTGVSLDRVRSLAGDLAEGQLQKVVNTPERNALIVATYREHLEGRKAVVFTAGVEHAEDLAAVFTEAGYKATSVSGNDPERATKLLAFKAGEYDVITNAMILTEGFDDKTVSAVLMARPTKSKPLYTQMVGRGLRQLEGKEDCIIADFTDTASKHRLVNVWDFWGAKLRGKVVDRPTSLKDAEEEAHENLAPAVSRFAEMTGRPLNLDFYAELLDVLAPPPEVEDEVLGAYRWHNDTATEPQLTLLGQEGYDITNDWTKGQASAVIGRLPASQKQLKLLLAFGFDTVGREWTRNQASKALKDIQTKGREADWSILGKLGKPSGPARKLRRIA